ncbi:hypothetical protein [Desulfuromonas acetoxidans]|uniref:hypothetical protein n=1 Tax=Desulfuromonas acetoxidans TaxID=891 RepID=UPI00292FE37E
MKNVGKTICSRIFEKKVKKVIFFLNFLKQDAEEGLYAGNLRKKEVKRSLFQDHPPKQKKRKKIVATQFNQGTEARPHKLHGGKSWH